MHAHLRMREGGKEGKMPITTTPSAAHVGHLHAHKQSTLSHLHTPQPTSSSYLARRSRHAVAEALEPLNTRLQSQLPGAPCQRRQLRRAAAAKVWTEGVEQPTGRRAPARGAHRAGRDPAQHAQRASDQHRGLRRRAWRWRRSDGVGWAHGRLRQRHQGHRGQLCVWCHGQRCVWCRWQGCLWCRQQP